MKRILIYGIYFISSYLIGTISWSYLFSKIVFNEDIRKKGSGNAGASNITINYGWKYGVLIFLLDFFKTIIAMQLVNIFSNFVDVSINELFLLKFFGGIFSVLGHIYPFWMNYKGGKGTASGIGLIFGLNPILGLLNIILVIVITVVTKYVAITGISMWFLMSIIIWFMYKNIIIAMSLFMMFILSLYLHKFNIVRILNKQETKLKFKFSDKDKKLR